MEIEEIAAGILSQAVDIADERQRQQFLEEACGPDEQLRKRVEASVRDYLAAGSLLDSPAQLACGWNLTQDFERPEEEIRIGKFQLRERIGEGGMGVVYVADQIAPIKRRVALKVVRLEVSSQQVIARFEMERQTLALMDHPYIAKVFDGGVTEGGSPYFAMELVKGVSLTEFCKSRSLPHKERLDLFCKVCFAVEHAHQRGIIHRDLKPSNILVTMQDAVPVPKVIDFGIAKATHSFGDQSVYTAHRQLLGTPMYMSPEQAEMNTLDVDTRSDVFSLGVVLYELLTDTTPIKQESLRNASFDELRRMIREEQPARPSDRISTIAAENRSTVKEQRVVDNRRFAQSLRRELDWIVLKAMEKDRQRRYQSPREMAEDIQRYLNGEAVHACPPSITYRLSRVVRKHRGAILTGAIILSTIIAGSIISVWQAVEARKSALLAQSRSQLARSAIDDMYTKVAQEWLAQAGDMTELQKDFLEKALAYYEVLGQDNDRDPKVRIEKLRSQLRVANIHESLGRHPTAETVYSNLISDCDRTATDQDEKLQSLPVKLKAVVGHARLQQEIGKSKDVVKRLQESLLALQQQVPSFAGMDALTRQEYAEASGELANALRGASLATESGVSIDISLNLRKQLAEENPQSFEHRLALATAVSSKGTQQMWWGRENEGARKTFIEAEQMFTSLLQERPKDRSCRDAKVSCLWNHSVVLKRLGKKEEALGLTRQSVKIQEELHRDFPTDRKLQLSLAKNLGNLANNLDHSEEALDCVQRACDLGVDLIERFPDVVEYRSTFALNSYRLSLDFYIRKDHAKGTAALERMTEKFQGYAWADEAWGASGRLASLFAISNCTWAGMELEIGNHARATQILSKLPSIEWPVDELSIQSMQAEHGVEQAQLQLLGSIENRIMLHNRPLFLYRECMQLASIDSSLSHSEQLATIAKYRELAAEYEAKTEQATMDWIEYLKAMKKFNDKKISWVNIQCKRLLAELEPAAITLAIEDKFIRQNQCRLCKLLIGDAMKKFPEEKDLYVLVDYLVVGPEELRDPELALELAQRSTKAYGEKPIDPVVYAHTWALYRAGLFRDCLDLYSASKIKVDYFSVAIKAMSLWQLGQREEAAALLNAEYDQGLAGYVQRETKRVQDKKGSSTPRFETLLALDREAKAMILGKQPTD
jgi:serine/threonine protein kinase